jgi:hypothetical protein
MATLKNRRAGRALALGGCVALSVMALLLWGRLKLVAGVPRTALADPEQSQPQAGETSPRGTSTPR